MMLNKWLYSLLKRPELVRLAKGALAVALSAGCAYLVQNLANTDPAVVPPIIVAVVTPLLLALDKLMQAWGKNGEA